jgi:HAD superfamily phosphoserine phosphatase-like hydrolase
LTDPAVPDAILRLPPSREPGLAVFDADGTLWHGDVSEDFARWMIARGAFDGESWPEYEAIAARDSYGSAFAILRFYVGMPADAIDAHARAFWRDTGPRRFLARTVAAIRHCRALGLRTAIVSGSPLPTLVPLLEHVPVDAILALDLELDAQGRATGRHRGIATVDRGKPERIRAESRDPVVVAAGNSILDAPMLELARVAWAVNPDSGLRAHAQARGWIVTDDS